MSSPIICEISRVELGNYDVQGEARITDVRHLASYNWMEASTPTITVPGCPPVWSNVKLPKKLKKDTGHVYIAQNAARHPESPLEPLFRALDIEDPTFDMHNVDVVSDRNNIRKLLSFVEPTMSKGELESFTIRAEVTGETVLLCREEAKVEEYIGPNEFKGFGHEFEKAYTTSQITGSTGHHRIISFHLNNLNVVIRHETDGYVERNPIADAGPILDDIVDMVQDLSLAADNIPSGSTAAGSKMTIKKAGRRVALASTLEIKTRVASKPLWFDEVAPQLWLSQTPMLVRAYHVKGSFNVPAIEDVHIALKNWEAKHEKILKVLIALVTKILDVVKEHGRAIIQYHSADDKLTVRQAEHQANMLPNDVYLRWTKPACDNAIGRNSTIKCGTAKDFNEVTTRDSLESTLRVGSDLYSIPLEKFPYLQAFVENQTILMPPGGEIKHEPIPMFDVAIKGVLSGYRQCFRGLDVDVSLVQQLCDTYDLLRVDVFNGQMLDDIILNIKAGKTDYDSETKRDKRLARDSAFRLVYYILCKSSSSDRPESDKLYNAVQYIVSHPGTFKYRARNVVRAVYDSRSQQSAKQRAQLDRWKKGQDLETDSDTTLSDPSYYYDSSDEPRYYVSD